jgi:hypothetical protein
MSTVIQRTSYEKLIGQTVYIEENMPAIQEAAFGSRLMTSRAAIRLYFEKYINKVEALFRDVTVVDDSDGLNRIPFIVLGSSFTLRDRDRRVYYCHLTHDNTWEDSRNLRQLYFLSETGFSLLMREEGAVAAVNMGSGRLEHQVGPISIA